MSSWSDRNKRKGKFYFAARGYPRVAKNGASTKVTTPIGDREKFYRDDAVVLTDADMDKFDGIENYPICIEHEQGNVVAKVHHTFLGDGENRGLKVIGCIDLDNNPRGEAVAQEIKAGKYKGMSVGYNAVLSADKKNVDRKVFYEISLVKDPFFDECRLDCAVAASKEENNNSNPKLQFDIFDMQIRMSENPPAAVPAQELLAEVGKLKELANTEQAAKEALLKEREAEKKEIEELREMKKQLDEHNKKAAAVHASNQLPKYERHVAELEAGGSKLTDEVKNGLKQIFCSLEPRSKILADAWDLQTENAIKLRASKVEAEKKLADEVEKNKKIEQTINHTAQAINASRKQFAETEKIIAAEIPISASSRPGFIKCNPPNAEEQKFLCELGFSIPGMVSASSQYGGGKQLITEIPIACGHHALYDSDGNTQYPNSARNAGPGFEQFFSFLCSKTVSPIWTDDLSGYVRINQSKNLIERRGNEADMVCIPEDLNK